MADSLFAQPTPGGGQTVWKLSGWWKRAGALIIDSIIVVIPVFVLGVIAAVLVSASGSDTDVGGAGDTGLGILFLLGLLVAVILVPVLYYGRMMPATNGQTIGKQATGIRVVREDGSQITQGFALMRQIVVMQLLFGLLGAFLYGLPQIINYLWPLWDGKNQALHDKIVKSRVVLAQPVSVGQPGYAQPQFPQAPFPGQPPAPPAPQVPGPQAPAPMPAAPPEAGNFLHTAMPPQRGPQPPAPPARPSGSVPYTPPPGFENPVPEEEK